MVSLAHAGQDVGLRPVACRPPPPLTEGGSAAGSTLRQAWPCSCLASMWVLLLTAGCTSSPTRMYSGPARPRGEVARLDARMFGVTQVDGTAIQESWQFLEFLPGCHSIGVVLDWREGRKVPQANSGGDDGLRAPGARAFSLRQTGGVLPSGPRNREGGGIGLRRPDRVEGQDRTEPLLAW